MKQLAEAYREENDMATDALVPAHAVARSASGLDPDIYVVRIDSSREGREGEGQAINN